MDVPDEQVNALCMGLMEATVAELSKPEGDPSCDLSIVRGSLAQFADILVYKEPGLVGRIPRDPVCQTITQVIARCDDAEIVGLAIVVVANYMDACNLTIPVFIAQKILKWLRRKIEAVSNAAASEILRICAIIGRVDPGLIVRKFRVDVILKNLTRCRPSEQRRALALVQQICENMTSGDVFIQFIPILLPFFEGNPPLKPFAIGAFLGIICRSNDVPASVFPTLARIIALNTDIKIIQSVVHALRVLRGKPATATMAVRTELDFEKLLGYVLAGESIQLTQEILRMLLEFLPCAGPPLVGILNLQQTATDSAVGEIIPRIRPALQTVVIDRLPESGLALLALTQALAFAGESLPAEVYAALAGFLETPEGAMIALYCAAAVGDPNVLVSSGAFYALRGTDLSRLPLAPWFSGVLDALAQKCQAALAADVKEFSTLQELIDFLNQKPITPFAFEGRRLVDQAVVLLQNYDRSRPIDVSPLADMCGEVLDSISFGTSPEEAYSVSAQEMVHTSLVYTVICDGRTTNRVSMHSCAAFVAFEALANENRGLSPAALASAIPDISLSRLEGMNQTEKGVLYRHYNVPGYRRYSFDLDGKRFSPNDSPYHATMQTLPSPQAVRNCRPVVTLTPESKLTRRLRCDRTPRESAIPPRLASALQLAKALHLFDPAVRLQAPVLEARLRKLLPSALFPIIVGYNLLLTIVFTYPFLFSVRIKADLFRITSLDVHSAMAFAHASIFGGDKKLLGGRSFVTPTIRRAAVLEDGCRVLREFAPGPVHIDLLFEGEIGIGSGLTYEFLDLFARELARRDLNLWRDSGEGSDGYAFTEIGLFPRPDADPEMFYVIGLLCGKTLAMNAALPLPLSEQFFRFLDGEELTVADIDQAFAQALAAKEDLVALEIPFSYPGIDELLLVDGGDELCVTDENYDEYVRLVQDFTYGAKLEALRKQFLKGLFSVIENGVWDRLTACEKVMLLSGDTHEVTMSDLEAHVSFEHGYDAHCPQRIMLFETICEMDGRQKQHLFKFITGCERLPVGGLSALTPKITVARRVSREGQAPDETLPTASTCTHYFKLPPYSSKRILRDRIVLAITEGSIGFNLS